MRVKNENKKTGIKKMMPVLRVETRGVEPLTS